MRTSKLCWLLMAMLCLMLWPVAVTAHGDWRVAQVQELLKDAGFNPGPIDGILGPRTKGALRRYQASQGLPATGALDKATRQALLPSGRPPEGGEAKPEATQQIPSPSGRPPEGGEAKPEAWLKAPPSGNFKKVSSLVQMPDFVSGLGTLYVDPTTLPQGPFLAYDRQGNLVSSVYMLPVRDLRARKSFNDLAVAHAKTDHVDVYANNGHPGVPDPHYHVVLWYISREQAATLVGDWREFFPR
jgi:peptidoglycan hydrolase-like protein with peptidoglycan-binding domain